MFELTSAQKRCVNSLAFWMFGFGIVYPALGIITTSLRLFYEPKYLLPSMLEILICLGVGVLTWQAAREFQRAVHASGDDAVHLLNALMRLRTLYWFQAILALGGFILFVCFLVIA